MDFYEKGRNCAWRAALGWETNESVAELKVVPATLTFCGIWVQYGVQSMTNVVSSAVSSGASPRAML